MEVEKVAVEMNNGTTRIINLPLYSSVADRIILHLKEGNTTYAKFVKITRNNFLLYKEEKRKGLFNVGTSN